MVYKYLCFNSITCVQMIAMSMIRCYRHFLVFHIRPFAIKKLIAKIILDFHLGQEECSSLSIFAYEGYRNKQTKKCILLAQSPERLLQLNLYKQETLNII